MNLAMSGPTRAGKTETDKDVPGNLQRQTSCICSAFSLLELLVVVAILVLVTTMYWGRGKKNRNQQTKAACQQSLQRLFISLQIYSNEQSGKFPFSPGAVTSEQALDLLVPKYTVDTSLFICPGTKDAALLSGSSLTNGRISYAYFMGRDSTAVEPLVSDQLVDTLPKSTGQNAFSSTGKGLGSNHGNAGGIFLFTDGQTQDSPPRILFNIPFTPNLTILNPKP